MLYTGPWGSVHFFPLCFLYWIISINLSLSSLTLLCHSFLLLSPHRRSYKCPSISPHEGQRVKQDMNLNSNRESCLQVFWYLALVALCQQKIIHAKMTVGKNGSSTFCRLIKHTHTYIHTHTQIKVKVYHGFQNPMWPCSFYLPRFIQALFLSLLTVTILSFFIHHGSQYNWAQSLQFGVTDELLCPKSC